MIILTIDTTAVIVSAIGTLGTIIIAVATIVLNNKVKGYHAAVNGKMDKLLEVTGEAEKAKGDLQGRADLKQEQKNDQK